MHEARRRPWRHIGTIVSPAHLRSPQTLKVESIRDREAWDRFVRASDCSAHYHLFGWRAVLEKTYGNTTIYLAGTANGEIRGILPLALVRGFHLMPHLTSLPYLSWAGVCTDDTDLARALIREAGQWGQRVGARYVELHNTRRVRISNGLADDHKLVTSSDKVAMVLPLPRDPEILWCGLKAKVRNQVKKARKSGLTVETGGAEYLDAFYEVYCENMRDLGSPVHSRQFFRNLLNEFPEDTRLFIVCKDSRPAGGALLVTFKDTAEVPWASSRREFLQYCPNNLLYWEMLRFTCQQGLGRFDFGRSTLGTGTYRFKKQWGSEPRPLYWQYYLPQGAPPPDPSHTGLASRILVSMWKRLPLGLANTVGPRIRGHISA